MKDTNKKGFTLVELIIVITILAVLATMAFISFQSYSADARNTKRKSDIDQIAKSVELKVGQGVKLLDLVSGSGSRLSTGYIAGAGITTLHGTAYEAGNVNLTVLSLSNEFKDGGKDYKIGVTTKAGGVYQIAGTLESSSLTGVAFVRGNFTPRTSTGFGVGYFKEGDTLAGGLTVVRVSPDLSTLTLSNNTTTGAVNARLAQSDVAGLIASSGSSSTPVVDGSTNALPY